MTEYPLLKDINYKTDKSEKALSIFFLLLFFFILFIFPATRQIGIDRDSGSYAQNAKEAIDNNFSNVITGSREPTFFLIVYIAKLIFPDPIRGTFVIYAFLGVLLKCIGICKLSCDKYLSFVLYIAFFYILQEFNTIRSGIATGIFLLSYEDLCNKDLKKFLFKILIATFFHYSSIVLVIFYLVNVPFIKKHLNFFLVLGILMDVLHLNIYVLRFIALISPAFIGVKLNIYINMLESGFFTSVSTQRLIFNIGFLFIILILENTSIKNNEKIRNLLNIFKISVAFFFATKCVPVVASRISETSSIVLVLLVPEVVKHFRKSEYHLLVLLVTVCCIPLLLMYLDSYYHFY